jgi:hypothetical protein
VTSDKQTHHEITSIKPCSLANNTPLPLQLDGCHQRRLGQSQKSTSNKNPHLEPKDGANNHMGTQLMKLNEATS